MFGSNKKFKIKWHPSLIIGLIGGVSAGLFYEVLILYSIVLFHEYGHVFMAKHLGWQVQSVTIWLFGGIMKTDDYHNRSSYEQFLVTIAGPLQHVFIYLLLLICSYLRLIEGSLLSFARNYNQLILLFNLVPIWPLDGGKMYHLVLNRWLPFVKAYKLTLVTSFVLISTLMIFTTYMSYFSVNRLILASFLSWQNYLDYKQSPYLFRRFLIGRYQIDMTHLKKQELLVHSTTPIKELVEKFQSAFTHVIHIYDQDQYVTEHDILTVYFNHPTYTTVNQCIK
ncbi:sporulation factor SpoIVFB. Metallo peptidase. MEROPS family M50B [Pelagirhabdus alkalitolerans]|uniref:Sporulation factor SpoIVFB. Metallo peptidase. MEROPS family M50B n=1 Tax=Pelagirhabdus alkalitolerans TaxID=1612202 RepID=A0A1G6HPF7_9BACI|nr:site-2 protease family protein [Pelagirhabdus alkalitolerans]SDB96074.1 sporulation factor SpoIVFB. Metallo peptidase. MEROPS family M50B [Pelagirhabdus alkalitolerans]